VLDLERGLNATVDWYAGSEDPHQRTLRQIHSLSAPDD